MLRISEKQSSTDKLLRAAIDLMAEKGYHGTSTKEIAAAAGLNEVTLFRHFGSKHKLLGAAYDRFHYSDEMTKLFAESLVWDLHTDLLTISRTYHHVMNRNRKMLLIGLKEGSNIPGFEEGARRHPLQLKKLLTDYFNTMAAQGKAVVTNPEMQAMSFMWMNYGAVVSRLYGDAAYPDATLEQFIQESVRLFTRALTP